MMIFPVAFDSMGVRSMTTAVHSEIRILIDPSVSLAPYRYGLPPHKVEVERMKQKWEEIKKEISLSDVVIITHYHYDHHNPNEVDLFEGKKLLLKNPKEKINKSQMKRSAYFLEKLKKIEVEIDFCDNKHYEFENTLIEISWPVFHGINDKLGFVLEIYVASKKTFLFSSDVEGVANEDQLRFMLEKDAEIVFLDGPMTYMPHKYPQEFFTKSIENVKKLIEKTQVEKLVIDHHTTRDLAWRKKISEIFKFGEENGVKILSAAEFAGVEEELLEAKRKELWSSSF
ncbi:MAG: MBL fold metallo-hydrolase [Archaeoglobaceae archaeon]|nr:MBL fold metallo-hydrolase [Archaeoglobaceae archaeon]MCX8152138.1 MBL fold metallo-hydrolase [Archaeoglobaceae archaeon]MDW8013574.1 MBL fold metallo-hydrolase [Archaeoglobaceae archaeon]